MPLAPPCIGSQLCCDGICGGEGVEASKIASQLMQLQVRVMKARWSLPGVQRRLSGRQGIGLADALCGAVAVIERPKVHLPPFFQAPGRRAAALPYVSLPSSCPLVLAPTTADHYASRAGQCHTVPKQTCS